MTLVLSRRHGATERVHVFNGGAGGGGFFGTSGEIR